MTVCPPGGNLAARMNGRPAYAEEIEIRITDPAVSPGMDVPGTPKSLFGETVRVRFSGESEWQNVAVPVCILSRKLEDFSPGYGNVYRFSGLLTEPESPLISGAFDYAQYLRRKKVGVVLHPDSFIKLKDGSGPVRKLFDFRDWMLRRITEKMNSPDAQALTSGLLFGFSQGLNSEIKNDFLRSGTIHVLTVSGTHVALFASLLFLIFAFLPFRVRSFAVIFGTGIYAFLTGMREPSFRAVVMLTVFLLTRTFLKKTPPLCSLALAALILLLIDPDNLLSVGFQFSFSVVAALLLSGDFAIRIRDRLLLPDRFWLPLKYMTSGQRFKRWILTKFLTVLFCSLTAFASGIALSACYQGLFPGAAVIVNLLLLPLVWCCFLLAFPALLFQTFFVPILESFLAAILWLCDHFAGSGVLDFAAPPLWSIILFTFLFFILLIRVPPKIRLAALCAVIIIPVCWHFRTVRAEPEMLLLYGGIEKNRISLTVTDPNRRTARILNLPDYDTAMAISDFLAVRGISRCAEVTTSDADAGAVSGIRYLQKIRIDHAYVDPRQRNQA